MGLRVLDLGCEAPAVHGAVGMGVKYYGEVVE